MQKYSYQYTWNGQPVDMQQPWANNKEDSMVPEIGAKTDEGQIHAELFSGATNDSR